MKIKTTLEDTKIRAKFVKLPDGSWMWHGRCKDKLSGKSVRFWWTEEQLAAVMALGFHSVGEETLPGYDAEKLYATVEGLFEGWPIECLPVP